MRPMTRKESEAGCLREDSQQREMRLLWRRIPLQVCKGVDVVIGGVMGYYNAPDEVIKGFKKMSQMDVQQMGSECMSTWYGIQTTPEAIHRA